VFGRLIQPTDGNLYGTTYSTVFKITLSGALTTLHSFDGTDGGFATGGLVQATNGNFYGTTQTGGANGDPGGTVFKITPSGKLTTLYSFCLQTGCTDGWSPYAGLVQATDGSFYGTTEYGGDGGPNGSPGGTVFKITPSGRLTTLYSFYSQSHCSDGETPLAGLIQATSGISSAQPRAVGPTAAAQPSKSPRVGH
jgi:uncharacterized repeat protein (TIGR03803 family)